MAQVCDKRTLVRDGIDRGDRLRVVQDFYGASFLEVRSRWPFWRRARFRLEPGEFADIKREFERLS